MADAMRFWRNVAVGEPEDCWPWLGAEHRDSSGPLGYGKCTSPISRLAHRVAYTLTKGPIPAGLTIDHVREMGCTSKLCCNPGHLEAVTVAENNRRAAALRTHCPAGHPYAAPNLHVTRANVRHCRICDRDRHRAARLLGKD